MITGQTVLSNIAGNVCGSVNHPPWWDSIVYPPVSSDLLSWLKGNNNETDDGVVQKTDSWVEPNAENWTLSQSACCSVNGVDEKISMPDMPSDATITYQGTAVAVVNTTTKEITFTTAGTFYDLNVWTDL